MVFKGDAESVKRESTEKHGEKTHRYSRIVVGRGIYMKIKIDGHKSFYLPDNIEPFERLIEVNKMLEEELCFDGETMTVEDYFRHTWNKVESNGANLSKSNMDKIGFYLSKMPEQEGREDKEILSRNDQLEMSKGVRRTSKDGKNLYMESKYILHTDLSKEKLAEIGLIDNAEDINP